MVYRSHEECFIEWVQSGEGNSDPVPINLHSPPLVDSIQTSQCLVILSGALKGRFTQNIKKNAEYKRHTPFSLILLWNAQN